MPAHVIDAFVVELGLDPKNFDANKTKFLKALQEMEDRFNRTERRLGQGRTSSAGRLATGLGAIHHPILTAIDQLDHLADTAQTSGSKIARGMGVGATGLSRLASAGLLAYGAVKAVQGAVEKLQANVAETAGLGRTATVGGFRPGFASAAGIALSETLGKDLRAETAGWMTQVRQMIEEFQKSGNLAVVERFKFLPNVDWYKATSEDILLKMIQAAHEAPSTPAAVNLLTGAGMSQDLALAARQMGGAGNAERAILLAEERAVTEKQIEAANAMSRAAEQVKSQFDAVVRELTTFVSGPLTDAMGRYERFLHSLRTNPGGTVEKAPVIGEVSDVVRFFHWLFTKNPTPATPPAAIPPVDTIGNKIGRWFGGVRDRLLGRAPAAPAATAPIPPAATSTPPAPMPRNVGEAISQAEGTFRNGAPDYDMVLGGASRDRSGRYPYPNKPLTEMTLQEVYDYGINTLRPAHRADTGHPLGSSATGAFEITGQNIKNLAERWGLDMNSVRFDKDTQDRMAEAIRREQGFKAWEGFKAHPDLLRHANQLANQGTGIVSRVSASGGTPLPPYRDPGLADRERYRSQYTPAQWNALVQKNMFMPSGLPSLPPGDWKVNSNGEPYDRSLETDPRARDAIARWNSPQNVRAVKEYQRELAERRANVTNAMNDNSTSYDNDVHVGSVNVYASGASEAGGYSLGRTISSVLKRQMLTAGMNTGLP